MPVSLLLSAPLRPLADGATLLHGEGATVAAVLRHATAPHPDLYRRLFQNSETLRPDLRLYLGDQDLRYLQGLDTPVSPGDRLTLIAPVAAG